VLVLKGLEDVQTDRLAAAFPHDVHVDDRDISHRRPSGEREIGIGLGWSSIVGEAYGVDRRDVVTLTPVAPGRAGRRGPRATPR
jgi:hypothetical protein